VRRSCFEKPSDFRNRQGAADLPRKLIGDLSMSGNCFHGTSARKGPFSSRKADDVLNGQIFLAFLKGLTMTICAGDLWAIPDLPFRVTLDDRGSL
jgi:hypothetical protein